ncbi:hypothetical protein CPB83DRAFT_849759 [Crepidotus variabilis]|uniref:Uncharacterized protein n=1 Tax=Crepidotus variabilis TaxID=179855 RepID=A0A9P6ELM7_9AGAR|nr:hypothetical protein CPB83DRAFT_849759 [Crepidotus variabilis]
MSSFVQIALRIMASPLWSASVSGWVLRLSFTSDFLYRFGCLVTDSNILPLSAFIIPILNYPSFLLAFTVK